MQVIRLFTMTALCCSCSTSVVGDPSTDGGDITGLVRLEIEPANPTLEVTSGGGQTLQLRAIGVDKEGAKKELPQAQWTLDQATSGTLDEKGRFSATGVGGVSRVHVAVGALSASTELITRLKETVSGLGKSETARLGQPPLSDPAKAPVMIYPEAGTMIPSNLPPMLLQWKAGASTNELFKVALKGAHLEVTVLTDKLQWQAAPALWSAITTTAKGKEIEVTLLGTGKSSGPLFGSGPRRIWVAEVPISGTIYYWATGASSKKNGIVKIESGTAQRSDYYTQANNGSGRCAGCHAFSRDGKKAVFVEYKLDDPEWTTYITGIEVADKTPFIARDQLVGDFFTFSPEGDRLVSSSDGVLTILSAKDGSQIETIPQPGGLKVSHPDWSPVEEKLAVVLFSNYPSYSTEIDYHFCEGQIAVMEREPGGSWTHKVIVPSAGADDHNYYPAFSPDGQQIAFNKAQSKNNPELGDSACDLYSNPSASLHLISKEGGQPVELANANGKGTSLTNSWAKWAPALSGSKTWWLAFSSTRDYGRVLPNSSKPDKKGSKLPQIWISAIRLDREGDPSYPAFWLPGQDIASGNHLPFWTSTLK